MALTTRHTLIPLLILAGLQPSIAEAQGFFGSAGVSVDQGYESNLFATPDGFGPGARDLIMRVGPLVEGGYRSPRALLSGRYTVTTERYGTYSSLNRVIGQQDARVELGFWPSAKLAVGGTAFYLESNSPLELITGDTLILGRAPAHRLMAAPAMTYDFGPAWSVSAEYEFSREALADEAASVIHVPRVGVDWRVSPLTTWRFLYRARQFGTRGEPRELSQTAVLGWERELSRSADLELQGGARVFEGEVRPEISALIRRRMRHGELYFSADQGETTMIGERGLLNTRSVRAGVTLEMARYVTVTATPMLFHTWRGPSSATVRGIELETTAFIARGMTLVVSGMAARQRGNLGGPIESVPFLRVQAGIRVLYPGRPREDMRREFDGDRERDDLRRPGARAQ